NDVETAAINFLNNRSYLSVRNLLVEINKSTAVRVYRPDILHCCIKALSQCDGSGANFHDASIQMREQNRLLGRPLPKRAVGSTLLLKGLEAEVAVLLNTESMSAQNLYVAMTRGSMRLLVCSANRMVG